MLFEKCGVEVRREAKKTPRMKEKEGKKKGYLVEKEEKKTIA
jgi:hypothetical protein